MNVDKRNEIFEEKKHFVDMTIRKHFVVLRSCHMEMEDVKQELYVRLLSLIDNYNTDKCPNFDAYLMLNLKYKLWNLATGSKRYGMPEAPSRDFRIASLEALADSYEPQYTHADEKHYDYLGLEETIESLPKKEKTVLNSFLDGKKRIHCNNASLQSARRFLLKNNVALSGVLA